MSSRVNAGNSERREETRRDWATSAARTTEVNLPPDITPQPIPVPLPNRAAQWIVSANLFLKSCRFTGNPELPSEVDVLDCSVIPALPNYAATRVACAYLRAVHRSLVSRRRKWTAKHLGADDHDSRATKDAAAVAFACPALGICLLGASWELACLLVILDDHVIDAGFDWNLTARFMLVDSQLSS